MTEPDDRLTAILIAWQECLEGGREVDLDSAIRENPDLEEVLRQHHDALLFLGQPTGEGPDASVEPLLAEPSTKPERARLRPLPRDRYIEFRPAGEGGMGMVFWALDSDLNREVAFKVIRPDVATGERMEGTPAGPLSLTPPSPDTPGSEEFDGFRSRFLQEAWVTAGLEHPGIVPVYDLGETDHGVPYYTMRFVRGERTLADGIDEIREGGLEERLRLLEPFLHICDAMQYAHDQHVIHRDLKPANIALGQHGEVVVLDWGLAKLKGGPDRMADSWHRRVQEIRESRDLTTLAGGVGTPGYMSPEAALGRLEEVDERSDVYSLGAILYEILAGSLPFSFRTYAEFLDAIQAHALEPADRRNEQVPQALSDVCTAALRKDRAERTPTVQHLAEEIRTWQVQEAEEREYARLIDEVRMHLDASEDLVGDARLRRVDRAMAVAAAAAKQRSDDPDVLRLRKRAADLRTQALLERERITRRRMILRISSAALLVLALGAFAVVGTLRSALRSTERERDRNADLVREKGELVGTLQRTDTELRRSLKTEVEQTQKAESALGALREKTEANEALLADKATLLGEKESLLETTRQALAAQTSSRTQAEAERDKANTATEMAEDAAKEAQRRLDEARENLRQLFVEQGRREYLDGRPFRASALLAEAYKIKSDDPATRYLLRNAMRPLDGIVAILRPQLGPLVDGDVQILGGRTRVLGIDNSGRMSVWMLEHRGFKQLGKTIEHVRWAQFLHTRPEIVIRIERGAALVDADSGKVRKSFAGGNARLTAQGLSKDQGTLALGDESGQIHIYRVGSDDRPLVLKFDDARVVGLALDGSGRYLAAVDVQGRVRMWDAKTRDVLLDERTHKGGVRDFAAAEAADRFATLGRKDGTVVVWDLQRRKRLSTFRPNHGVQVALSHDGRHVAVREADRHKARLWSVDYRYEEPLRETHKHYIDQIAFGRGRATLMTGGRDGQTRIWDAWSGASLGVYPGHTNWVLGTVTDRDGRALLTLGQDGTGILWTPSSPLGSVYNAGLGSQWDVQISPDGKLAALSPLEESDVQLWSLETDRLVRKLKGHSGWTLRSRFDAEGRRLVTAATDKTARIWSISGSEPPIVLRGHTGPVVAASFSPDGKHVVTASDDKTARIWRASDGVQIHALGPHPHKVGRTEYSPDGRTIVTACDNDFVILWDAATATRRHVLSGLQGIRNLAFSPSGELLALATTSGHWRLYEVTSGKLLRTVRAHANEIFGLSFSPDGTLLGTASRDGTAALWSVADGSHRASLEGHLADVWGIVFTSDGTRALTPSQDGTVRLWSVPDGALLDVLPSGDWGKRMVAVTPDGNTAIGGGDSGNSFRWDISLESRPVSEISEQILRKSPYVVWGTELRRRSGGLNDR